jgi:hypothetical protein
MIVVDRVDVPPDVVVRLRVVVVVTDKRATSSVTAPARPTRVPPAGR